MGQKKSVTNYFCLCHGGHWRKEQGPDLDLDPVDRGADPDPYQYVMDPVHWFTLLSANPDADPTFE